MAKPANDSAPTMKPRRKPNSASTAANATMIQSRPVTAMFYRSHGEPPRARLRRALPVVALAVVAFALGAILGSNRAQPASQQLAASFVTAWAKGDYAHMYLDIDPASRRAIPADRFAGEYEQALRTATTRRLQVAGKPKGSDGVVRVPV